MFEGILIQSFITARYPGGMPAFDKKFAVFFGDGSLLIAPIEEGETLESDFREALGQLTESMDLKLVALSRSNFSAFGDDNERASEYFNSALREALEGTGLEGSLSISAQKALLHITAPGITKGSVKGGVLKEAATSLEHVPNVRILYKDGIEDCFRESSIKSKSHVALETGRPVRDIAITRDDVIDLKIALGSAQSVDEFLAMI